MQGTKCIFLLIKNLIKLNSLCLIGKLIESTVRILPGKKGTMDLDRQKWSLNHNTRSL